VLQRIGDIGYFSEPNIGEAQIAETRALTAGGRKNRYTLGAHRLSEYRVHEKHKRVAHKLRQDPDHEEPRLSGVSDRGWNIPGGSMRGQRSFASLTRPDLSA
jgi:hypothetical protein